MIMTTENISRRSPVVEQARVLSRDRVTCFGAHLPPHNFSLISSVVRRRLVGTPLQTPLLPLAPTLRYATFQYKHHEIIRDNSSPDARRLGIVDSCVPAFSSFHHLARCWLLIDKDNYNHTIVIIVGQSTTYEGSIRNGS